MAEAGSGPPEGICDFWCHQCTQRLSLAASSTVCSVCGGDFIELLEDASDSSSSSLSSSIPPPPVFGSPGSQGASLPFDSIVSVVQPADVIRELFGQNSGIHVMGSGESPFTVYSYGPIFRSGGMHVYGPVDVL